MKVVLISEVHGHVAQFYNRARTLGRKLEPDTLIRLDAQDHPVRMHPLHICVPENGKRCLVNSDRYLRCPTLQVLAGTEIEWHAGPTPVIDLQFAGYVGLRVRIWSDIRLVSIGLGWLSEDRARAIL